MEKLPDREFGGILAALMVLNGCAASAVNGDPENRIAQVFDSFSSDDPHQNACFSDLLQTEGVITIAESTLSQNGIGSCEKLKELEKGIRFRLRRAEASCILYQTESGKKDGTQRVMAAFDRKEKIKSQILTRCHRGERTKDLKIPKGALLASN